MERRSNSHTRPQTRWDWRFWLGWVVASVVGSAALCLEVVPAELFLPQNSPINAAMYVAVSVPALLIGLGQWIMLGQRLPLSNWLAIFWLCGSIIGMGTFMIFFNAFTAEYSQSPGPSYPGEAEVGGLFGAAAGVVQYVTLYDRLRWAVLWIGISTIGGLVGWPAANYVGDVVFGVTYGSCLGFIGIGVVTGLALTWLIGMPSKDKDNVLP